VGRELDLAPYSGARTLVFGATGFIGRHVASALVAAGAETTLSARDSASLQAVAGALDGQVATVACDVCDDARVVAAIRQTRPHVTFNLAGYGVDRSETDVRLAERINARFPRVLCDAIAAERTMDWRGQALIHAGTQLEYGKVGGNLGEDTDPSPDTVYGRTKLQGTRAVARCAATHSTPALTARLFTVYGAGERADRLLPSIIRAAATGQPLDMTDGRQRADFTWIGDVVEGLLRLGVVPATADAPYGPEQGSGPGPGTIVNLATGRLTSVGEFALQAIEALGAPASLLRFGALPQRAETLEYEPVTNARLQALTGWAPATTVAEGLRLTIGNEDGKHE
jgi:UDP-glucose 4-epimerase